MKTASKIILCLMLGVTLLACSKGGVIIDDGNNGGGGGHVSNPADTIPPVITIATPTPDQVFTNGATINVTGNISDNNGLYRGSIRITNDANSSVIKEQAYEIHGFTSYNFNISHAATVSTLTNYTVTVWFEDHGYNAASKTVKIKVNP